MNIAYIRVSTVDQIRFNHPIALYIGFLFNTKFTIKSTNLSRSLIQGLCPECSNQINSLWGAFSAFSNRRMWHDVRALRLDVGQVIFYINDQTIVFSQQMSEHFAFFI